MNNFNRSKYNTQRYKNSYDKAEKLASSMSNCKSKAIINNAIERSKTLAHGSVSPYMSINIASAIFNTRNNL